MFLKNFAKFTRNPLVGFVPSPPMEGTYSQWQNLYENPVMCERKKRMVTMIYAKKLYQHKFPHKVFFAKMECSI